MVCHSKAILYATELGFNLFRFFSMSAIKKTLIFNSKLLALYNFSARAGLRTSNEALVAETCSRGTEHETKLSVSLLGLLL